MLLNKGSNGRKSRPVFSLFPFSSRLLPGHSRNAGDFAPNRHFRHFPTPNRPRTTWSVQRRDVQIRLVLLNKGSNGCKSRPVFSLFLFLLRFACCHTSNRYRSSQKREGCFSDSQGADGSLVTSSLGDIPGWFPGPAAGVAATWDVIFFDRVEGAGRRSDGGEACTVGLPILRRNSGGEGIVQHTNLSWEVIFILFRLSMSFSDWGGGGHPLTGGTLRAGAHSLTACRLEQPWQSVRGACGRKHARLRGI